MIRFIGILFAFVLLVLSSANAAGLRMGPNNMTDDSNAAGKLADAIQTALTRDSSGNGVIAGHPCVTPNMYAAAIRRLHPSAKLGAVQELPAYLRQLKYERQGPAGTFPMGRILQSGSSCTLDVVGWTRSFHQGEGAWRDPNTGEIILAGDCGNVVGGAPPALPPPPARVVDACVEIPVEALRSPGDRQIVQVALRITLHVWGPKIEGCGLRVVDCYCVDPVTGKAAVGYTTTVITGSGMVRIPRELALRLEAICIVAEGLWPERGVLIRQEMVVRDIQPLAFAGERIVLPEGKGINFYQTGRPHG